MYNTPNTAGKLMLAIVLTEKGEELGEHVRGLLRIFAWLTLASGIVLTFMAFSSENQSGLGITLALGNLFGGVIIWALFHVIVNMADSIARIEGSVAVLHRKAEQPDKKKEVKSYSIMDRI